MIVTMAVQNPTHSNGFEAIPNLYNPRASMPGGGQRGDLHPKIISMIDKHQLSTALKTNGWNPKNCWFVDVSPFPMGYFSGSMLVFGCVGFFLGFFVVFFFHFHRVGDETFVSL